MSILAGVFSRHADDAPDDAICDALRQAISRHPGEDVHVVRDARAFLALVDVGAYGEPACRRDPNGSVSIMAGEPLVVLGDDELAHGRADDLAQLHAQWNRGDWSLLRHAQGTFCAIHYQPEPATITLIADKLGVRALYYWIGERYVVFASALRILEQVPQVPKHLHLRAVAELAALGMPLADRTPYEEVALLRAAEIVRVGPATVSRTRYWRWDAVQPSSESETTLLRAAHDRFRQSIARRARADTAVVAFLSGGLDSRVITGALRARGAEVHTLNFAAPGTQDSTFARQFAAAAGTRHRDVELPAGIEDTRRKVMLGPLVQAAGDAGPHAAEHPRVIWSGDGGSVGFGHVYMSRAVVQLLRTGRQREAIACFLHERAAGVAHRVLQRAIAEQSVAIPAQGIEEELEDIHCDDPGRGFYLFLMLNDQRRHLARHFEDLDLHRLEFHLPFFDGRFLELVASLPTDWCLEHRFYTKWLRHFPPAVTAVPWQTYPGHEPCPVPLPPGVRDQWDRAELATIAAARKQTRLRQAREMLAATEFPHHLLRRGYLRATTAAYRLGLRDYGYVIADANSYYTHWRRCTPTASARLAGARQATDGAAHSIIRACMHAVPFFQTGATPAQERARLLLLSYHFPPSQAAGALRWEKLTRYAAERSWGVDVITLDPSSQDAPDAHRMRALPAGVRVYGIPAAVLRIDQLEHAAWRWWRAHRPRSAAVAAMTDADHGAPTPRVASSFAQHEVRWLPRTPRDALRAYNAMLEYRRSDRWARRAATLARTLIQPGVHRAVISCGPPHMVHDAGRRVATATGLPFVMDLRDPWSFVQRLPEGIAHPVWWRLAALHERRAVSHAALVVGNTELVRRELVRRYPQWHTRFQTVMNGYDDDPLPDAATPHRFTIAYAGSIYLDRDPRPLFRAAGRVIRELGVSPADFGIDLIGSVCGYDGMSIRDMARREGIEPYVTAGPARPRRDAMAFLAQAALLVSLPQDSDMAIPSKVFEYMRFNAWLLALAEPDSATGLLLADTSADVVAPHDVDAMTAVLRQRYLEHARGIRPQPIARDERFSRRSQAMVLFDAIEARIGPALGDLASGPHVDAQPRSGASV